MRHKVSSWFLFVLLTVLLFTLRPVATAASSDNYGEYSLMTQRHAGQFYSDGSPAGQWAWTPQGEESEALWGDPSKWPPDSAEHFIHAGNWVLLDGYGWLDHDTHYIQRVSRELIGDGSCRNMTPLPSEGGRQHYVQWKIAPDAYCLQAWGTITERQDRGLLPFAGVVTAEHVSQRLPRGPNLHTPVGVVVGQQRRPRCPHHAQAGAQRVPCPRCRDGLRDRPDLPTFVACRVAL
jgi:hypothetical protein